MLARMYALLEPVVSEIAIVAAGGKYESSGYKLIADRWPAEGPLGGVLTALAATGESQEAAEWNVILSCDMPFLTREWLTFLGQRATASAASVVLPRSSNGLEPLCACWKTAAQPWLQAAFDGGVRKVIDALKQVKTEVLDERDWKRFDSHGRLFWNMNTPADYREAQRIWARSASERSSRTWRRGKLL